MRPARFSRADDGVQTGLTAEDYAASRKHDQIVAFLKGLRALESSAFGKFGEMTEALVAAERKKTEALQLCLDAEKRAHEATSAALAAKLQADSS
eukprot:m.141197 g.141197  ORF g.141197 m.141197 type:complete len:95 (+) comp52593_c0_seq16:285-569(+)